MTYPSNLNSLFKKKNQNLLKLDFYSKKHFVDIFHETFEVFTYFKNLMHTNRLYKWIPSNGLKIKRTSNNNIFLFFTITNNLKHNENILSKLTKIRLRRNRPQKKKIKQPSNNFLIFKRKNEVFVTLDQEQKLKYNKYAYLKQLYSGQPNKSPQKNFHTQNLLFILKKINNANKNKYFIFANLKNLKHFKVNCSKKYTKKLLQLFQNHIFVPKILKKHLETFKKRKKHSFSSKLLKKNIKIKNFQSQFELINLQVYKDSKKKNLLRAKNFLFDKALNNLRNVIFLQWKYTYPQEKYLKRLIRIKSFLRAKKSLFIFRRKFYLQLKENLKKKIKNTRMIAGTTNRNQDSFIKLLEDVEISKNFAFANKLINDSLKHLIKSRQPFVNFLRIQKFRKTLFKINSKKKGRLIKRSLKYLPFIKSLESRFLFKKKLLLNFLKIFGNVSNNHINVNAFCFLFSSLKSLRLLNLTEIFNIVNSINNCIESYQKKKLVSKSNTRDLLQKKNISSSTTFNVKNKNILQSLNNILLFDSYLLKKITTTLKRNNISKINVAFYNKIFYYKVLLSKKTLVETRMKLIKNEIQEAFNISNANVQLIFQNLINFDEKIITNLKKITQDKKQTITNRIKILLKEGLITQNFDNFNRFLKRILERKNTRKFNMFAQQLSSIFKELFYELFLNNVYYIARQREFHNNTLKTCTSKKQKSMRFNLHLKNPEIFKTCFPTSILFQYKGKLAKAGRKQKLVFFVKNPFIAEFLKLYKTAYILKNNLEFITKINSKEFIEKYTYSEKLNTLIELNLKKGGTAGLRFHVQYLAMRV